MGFFVSSVLKQHEALGQDLCKVLVISLRDGRGTFSSFGHMSANTDSHDLGLLRLNLAEASRGSTPHVALPGHFSDNRHLLNSANVWLILSGANQLYTVS